MNVRESMRLYLDNARREVGKITGVMIGKRRRCDRPRVDGLEPGVYQKIKGRWKKTDDYSIFPGRRRR